MRRAWVLSGGGNRGPLQVGAMRALLERGREAGLERARRFTWEAAARQWHEIVLRLLNLEA